LTEQYSTKSQYLAAVLICFGNEVTTYLDRDRVVFQFVNTPELQQLVDKWTSRTVEVNAARFCDALVQVRNRVHDHRRQLQKEG